MYVGRDWDPTDVGENEVYTLDYVNDLASNEGRPPQFGPARRCTEPTPAHRGG